MSDWPSIQIKQTEIDFGATPVYDGTFIVTDGTVSAGSHIICQLAYEAPTGKDLDEIEMDDLLLNAGPGSGQFTIYAKSVDGSYVHDKYKINYFVT